MFGKLMSISDDLMWRYFELLSFRTLTDIEALRKSVGGGVNPRDIKFELAMELTARFHGKAAATHTKEDFIARFQMGSMPETMEEKSVRSSKGVVPIAHVLKEAGLVPSTSEGLRMIRQGAVRMDGERVEDERLEIPAGSNRVYQVGKRKFARIRVL
jgi:tyrosyl-tRNA synthetase